VLGFTLEHEIKLQLLKVIDGKVGWQHESFEARSVYPAINESLKYQHLIRVIVFEQISFELIIRVNRLVPESIRFLNLQLLKGDLSFQLFAGVSVLLFLLVREALGCPRSTYSIRQALLGVVDLNGQPGLALLDEGNPVATMGSLATTTSATTGVFVSLSQLAKTAVASAESWDGDQDHRNRLGSRPSPWFGRGLLDDLLSGHLIPHKKCLT
jgi:hypothetical protein